MGNIYGINVMRHVDLLQRYDLLWQFSSFDSEKTRKFGEALSYFFSLFFGQRRVWRLLCGDWLLLSERCGQLFVRLHQIELHLIICHAHVEIVLVRIFEALFLGPNFILELLLHILANLCEFRQLCHQFSIAEEGL